MSETSDVLIIGAGAIGSAAAYYLAKRKISVTVLEKSEYIGNGGSSRNGGGVRQSGRHSAELPLAMYGVKNLWPNLSQELGLEVEYCQGGNLRLGKTEAHLKILQGLTANCVAGGLDMRMIDYREAKEICPYLSEEVIGASWCPTDGHANPLLTTLAFYRAARKLGARYVSGAEVDKLVKNKGRVTKAITADGTEYEFGQAIVVAGYDSGKILATVGLEVPMMPLLMEILVTEDAPRMFTQMLGTAMADFYGHQSTHGSFVFGGTHGFEPYAEYGETKLTSVGASSTCRGIIGYFPVLSDLKIVRTWSGWIDDCADHIPVMGNPKETPGLTIGCAFSGHGFGISPVAGLLLAQLATGQETALDVSRFSYDRFRAKV
ncbi:MAG: FAD-binding oxidoreductase [Deltaproteobacteria bacterium]|jgi:sarcosine oxidase subunit beta|nr:FAD-binding oxidoreductase [Deltaproteobacteria bacterium]